MKRPTILLSDDYAAFFDLLPRLLEPEFQVIGTVKDGEALIAAAIRLIPDIIISDIGLPIVSGFEALRQLIAIQPDIRYIFLTIHKDRVYIEEAQRAGASGYVNKSHADTELVPAIRKALRKREFYLSKFGT